MSGNTPPFSEPQETNIIGQPRDIVMSQNMKTPLVLAGSLAVVVVPPATEAQRAGAQTAEGLFKPDWQSLKAHQDPEWFRDAKWNNIGANAYDVRRVSAL